MLEDKINGVSSETAEELSKAFEEFNKSAEDFCAAFDEHMKAYMESCVRATAMMFVDYMYRYANGTFLTRWYWLRKARKCNDVLKEIIQLNEEYLKH